MFLLWWRECADKISQYFRSKPKNMIGRVFLMEKIGLIYRIFLIYALWQFRMERECDGGFRNSEILCFSLLHCTLTLTLLLFQLLILAKLKYVLVKLYIVLIFLSQTSIFLVCYVSHAYFGRVFLLRCQPEEYPSFRNSFLTSLCALTVTLVSEFVIFSHIDLRRNKTRPTVVYSSLIYGSVEATAFNIETTNAIIRKSSAT